MRSFSNTRGPDGEPIEIKAPPVVDINAWDLRSFLTIVPATEDGRDWCAEHIYADVDISGGYLCEHRYGPDIPMAAHNAGLTVAFDGRIADATRDPFNLGD